MLLVVCQLYEPSGSYSIIIEKAEPDGIGALAIQFEQLKKNWLRLAILTIGINKDCRSLLKDWCCHQS